MRAARFHAAALALVLGAGLVPSAWSQSVRSVLGNGGTPASNGSVSLQGTVGQPIVGLSAGANTRAGHGFWSYTAAPLLDAPGAGASARFALGQASPSPARGSVRFALTLPRAGIVELTVFDAAGRRLGERGSQHLAAGSYQLDWSSSDNRPGVYFARFAVDGRFVGARRIVLTH